MKTDEKAIAPAFTATFVAADGDEDSGKVKALVSAYDVKYKIGYWTHHTIEKGAFSAYEGSTIPLYAQHSWSHRAGVPIGHATVTETDDGLEIEGELYLDDSNEARVIHKALKAGALEEWSIGYRVIAQRLDDDDDEHFYITEAELLEASAVLRGANPETRTLEVASAPDGDRTVEIDGTTYRLVATQADDPKNSPESTTDEDWTPPADALASEWVREYINAEPSAPAPTN